MAVRDWAFVSVVALSACLGAYLSGYSIGSANGLQNFSGYLEYFELGNSSANSSCTETTHLSENARNILGTIISIVNLGGVVGSLVAGKPADYFGRKVTLLMSGVLVVLGTAVQGSAVQGAVWMVILGRFVAGAGYGIFYMACPVYVAEVSPKHIRGILTSLVGPIIALGLISGYITNLLLYDKPYGWRVSRLLACVFGCFYVVIMSFMPRTPRWLMLKGRESEARDVLRKTAPTSRGPEAVEEELEDIKSTLDPDRASNCLRDLRLLIKWHNLKRLLFVLPLHMLTPLCGTAVYYYSEPLFCSLGILPFVTALVIGALTIVGTTFTTIFIDKLGRKPLLVGGAFVLGVLSAIAGTLVYAFNLEENNDDVVGYIVVCVVCLFMLVYSATWYVVPWIVTSEVFPLEGRAVAVALCVAFDWTFGYAITQAFPALLASLQTFGTLYLLTVFDVTAGLYFLFLLPETKGISLEQMDGIFTKPWLERIGFSGCLRCCQPRSEDSKATQATTVSGHVNEVVVTEESSNDVHLHSVKQRHSFIENDKDWEDYWEHYDTEVKKLGKETNV